MSELIMPKNEGRLDFFDESIQFISENGGIMKTDEFVAKEQQVHPGLDTTSCYHKIVMARYFGLVLFNNYSSYYFLTESGSKYSKANNNNKKIDAILNALTAVTFGRNNNAVSSDSDIEAPIVMLKAIAAMGSASMTQIGLILYHMDKKEMTLSDAINEVLKCEYISAFRKKLTESQNSKYFDVKFNKLFEELGIVDKNQGNYVLSQYVKEKHLDFINNLPELKPMTFSESEDLTIKSNGEYELTITADEVISTDETFTMNNLESGDKFKPIDAYFVNANGDIIRRNHVKSENKISNMTLPRIAIQLFEKQIIALTEDEKENFPICKYNPNSEVIRGIFPSVEKFKQYKNSIENLVYRCEDNSQLVIYSWNIFSTIIFVQECLKRFGKPGDSFKLLYCAKEENEISEHEWTIEYCEYETDKIRNRIVFGAPGTGKSYTLEKDKKTWLDDSDYCERVTFHTDYSYANFVGVYKPIMVQEKSAFTDEEQKYILSILANTNMSGQEKYDKLYDKFNDAGSLTRLPVLLGLYTDDDFKTKKSDRTPAVGDNSVERNHGRAIRPYVDLKDKTKRSNDIAYEYVPGPFMRTLVKALENPNKPALLIIEEINRAQVAAVFGDVFQLLDRDSSGISEYAIATSEDMRKYLVDRLQVNESYLEKIKIPSNMFIWATMNSADQGVFPMDTAFKRRWEFEYLDIDDGADELPRTGIAEKWNNWRMAINNYLTSRNVNEDKLMGPFFISKIVMESDDEKQFNNVFKNKVLMYLFEDAGKRCKNDLFAGCEEDERKRYSLICNKFDEIGIKIFDKAIWEGIEV